MHTALVTADLLSDHGINAAVIDMHTIKPLDEASLGQHLDKKLLVTLEEHSVIGGLAAPSLNIWQERKTVLANCVWAFRRAIRTRVITHGCLNKAV